MNTEFTYSQMYFRLRLLSYKIFSKCYRILAHKPIKVALDIAVRDSWMKVILKISNSEIEFFSTI